MGRNKNLTMALILSTMLTIFSTGQYAYAVTQDYSISMLPLFRSYTYYVTSYTDSSAYSPISSAMTTWNTVYPNVMSMGCITSTTKPLSVNDTYNTIGSEVNSTRFHNLGGSSSAIAINILQHPNGNCIEYSDIVLNAGNYLFGNVGYSTTYQDYQGVFTHELGHTWGLDDIYSTSATSVNSVPTMYGNATFNGINVYVFFRTLESGDRAGMSAIKTSKGW